jgi:hypothetical protein
MIIKLGNVHIREVFLIYQELIYCTVDHSNGGQLPDNIFPDITFARQRSPDKTYSRTDIFTT